MKTLDLVPRPIRAHLIGKAAVSLLSFHLARRGIDFAPTTDSSSSGDIWADMGGGVVAIEVKGSVKGAWHVRAFQTDRIAHWVFVGISDARCWLVEGDKVRASLGGKTTKVITLREIETMGGTPLHVGAPPVLAPRIPNMTIKARAARRVRKRLASGEVKEYVYSR